MALPSLLFRPVSFFRRSMPVSEYSKVQTASLASARGPRYTRLLLHSSSTASTGLPAASLRCAMLFASSDEAYMRIGASNPFNVPNLFSIILFVCYRGVAPANHLCWPGSRCQSRHHHCLRVVGQQCPNLLCDAIKPEDCR